MLREEWHEIEENVSALAEEWREKLFKTFRRSKSKVEKVIKKDPEEIKQEFISWGQLYVDDLKNKADGEKAKKAKENFYTLLRNLGVNESVVREAFKQNKEALDPLIGEVVAMISLVLGWKQKDQEAFSQALGEIGVAGVFATNPFLCLIAVCGLAYGYQENFHPEAFKKGGVLGLAGITAVTLSPSGFIGLLSAIVSILYLNKRLKVDRPIEKQLKEILQQVKSGAFFKEMRSSFQSLQDFIAKVLRNIRKQETGIQPVKV